MPDCLLIGSFAPDFECDTTQGHFKSFHEWKGDSWAILFSHPADFTPVCTTEMAAVARLHHEWEKRDCKVIGLSTDTVESHRRWADDIEDLKGQGFNFPVIADTDASIATRYSMLDKDTVSDTRLTVRAIYIIDPTNKIRLISTYPVEIGRNFNEIIRSLDSLLTVYRHPVVCPANWRRGQDVIVSNNISDEEAIERFPQGFRKIKPYLRYTPDPEQTEPKKLAYDRETEKPEPVGFSGTINPPGPSAI